MDFYACWSGADNINTFYDYLKNRNKPWKHEHLAELIKGIIAEDECNDTYGRRRIYEALKLEYPDEKFPKPEHYTIEELKTLIWRYFMSYWNNRRICSAIGGIPPAEKRRRYYAELKTAA